MTDIVIYDTAEFQSWSRDFSYEDYVLTCQRWHVEPFSETGYKLLCLAFEAEMLIDMGLNISPA